jgi:hypothetical protein
MLNCHCIFVIFFKKYNIFLSTSKSKRTRLFFVSTSYLIYFFIASSCKSKILSHFRIVKLLKNFFRFLSE